MHDSSFGSHWPCSACGTSNSNTATSCMVCGSAPPGGVATASEPQTRPGAQGPAAQLDPTAVSTDVAADAGADADEPREAELRGTLAAKVSPPSITPVSSPEANSNWSAPHGTVIEVSDPETAATDDTPDSGRRRKKLIIAAVVIVLAVVAAVVAVLSQGDADRSDQVDATSETRDDRKEGIGTETTVRSTTTRTEATTTTAQPVPTEADIRNSHLAGTFLGTPVTTACEGLIDTTCPGPSDFKIECVLSCSAIIWDTPYVLPLRFDGTAHTGSTRVASGYTNCRAETVTLDVTVSIVVTGGQFDPSAANSWQAQRVEFDYREESLPHRTCPPIVTAASGEMFLA